MAKRVTKQIPVTVHGGTMNENQQRRSIKDLEYDEVDYYRHGRNEPVPPDANIVSAVKARKKTYVSIQTIEKSEEEREKTEERVVACISNASRKLRTIPIPAWDPVNLLLPGEIGGKSYESPPPVPDYLKKPESVKNCDAPAAKYGETLGDLPVPNGIEERVMDDGETGHIMELPLFIKEDQPLSFHKLPNVLFTLVVNPNNFVIKCIDEPLVQEIKSMKKKIKEFYSRVGEGESIAANPQKLIQGAYYVYRIKMIDGNQTFARAQVMSSPATDSIRIFLCDYGFEMDVETSEDLYPLRKEWASVPQLSCWAQIGHGLSYLEEGKNQDFVSDHEGKSLKITPLGLHSVSKSVGPNGDVVSVQCCRLRVANTTRDFLNAIHGA